jgi:hypothetical protein
MDYSRMNWAAIIGSLVGALVGTFLISRLFWWITKRWPDRPRKAVAINVICAALIVPLDYIARYSQIIIWEIFVYGGCQCLVLLYDLLTMRGGKIESTP